MFLFYCLSKDASFAAQESRRGAVEPINLWTTLEAAQAACRGRILVVDGSLLPEASHIGGREQVQVQALPPRAVRNVDPYLPPAPVIAAGGYVVRRGAGEPEVLLIFRRGVWDLPKGKRSPGEHIEACALREVREEVGIDELRLVRSLGTTVHGYPDRGWYRIKTTYWFLMRTPETQFTPQAKEGIQDVAWFPWSEALQYIGYETFREHMRKVEPLVFAGTAAPESL